MRVTLHSALLLPLCLVTKYGSHFVPTVPAGEYGNTERQLSAYSRV